MDGGAMALLSDDLHGVHVVGQLVQYEMYIYTGRIDCRLMTKNYSADRIQTKFHSESGGETE